MFRNLEWMYMHNDSYLVFFVFFLRGNLDYIYMVMK